MTTSRRHLFAVLGLVLPVAAFAASPASAASSDLMHHKASPHHTSVSHKTKTHHTSSVHHTSHRTSHRSSPKVSAS